MELCLSGGHVNVWGQGTLLSMSVPLISHQPSQLSLIAHKAVVIQKLMKILTQVDVKPVITCIQSTHFDNRIDHTPFKSHTPRTTFTLSHIGPHNPCF